MFRKGFPGGRERARLGSGLLGRRFCLWFYATSSAEGLCLQFTLALSLLLFFFWGGTKIKLLQGSPSCQKPALGFPKAV